MAIKQQHLHHTSPSVDRILDAALHVFTQKGYDGASIRDIMKEADVTQPVIYYHFGNKQELFKATVIRNMRHFLDESEKALMLHQNHWDRLCALMSLHFSFHRRHPEKSAFLYSAFFGMPRIVESQRLLDMGYQMLGLVTGELKALQQEGFIRGGDPELMALSLIGVFNMFKMRHMLEPDFICDDDKADLILRGFLLGHATKETMYGMWAEQQSPDGTAVTNVLSK